MSRKIKCGFNETDFLAISKVMKFNSQLIIMYVQITRRSNYTMIA